MRSRNKFGMTQLCHFGMTQLRHAELVSASFNPLPLTDLKNYSTYHVPLPA